jgi:hypothetical protein
MSHPPQALRIEPVVDRSLRMAVYRLRYRAYHAEGEIPASATSVFCDAYDEQPNHVLWALFEGDRLVGTLRSTFFDPNGRYQLPEHKVFGDLIPKIVPSDARIVSGNRFAVDPELDKNNKRYTFALFKQHMLVALVKADWAIAAVKQHHLHFYSRVMQLEQRSEARFYPEMTSGFYLMAANVLDNYPLVCSRHPTLRVSTADISLLNRLPALFDASPALVGRGDGGGSDDAIQSAGRTAAPAAGDAPVDPLVDPTPDPLAEGLAG